MNIYKKFLLFPIFLFVFLFEIINIFSLQINVTNIYPKVIYPTSNDIINLCLINNENNINLFSISLNIYTSSNCLIVNQTQLNVYYLQYNYCTPIKLHLYKCQNPLYIIINGTYEQFMNKTYLPASISYVYPIIIYQNQTIVNLYNYTYSNPYQGQNGILKLYFNVSNGYILNGNLYILNSTCIINSNEYYINHKTNDFNISINYYIPINMNYCKVDLLFNYTSNNYNEYSQKYYIDFSTYKEQSLLELNYYPENILSGNSNLTIYLYNPSNQTLKDINLYFNTKGNIYLTKNSYYINYLYPGEKYNITINVLSSNYTSGFNYILINTSYYEQNGLYNNQNFLIPINIISTLNPKIGLSISQQSNTLELNLYNYGFGNASNVVVYAKCNNNCIINPSSNFIGDLNSGNNNIATFTVNSLNRTIIYFYIYYSNPNTFQNFTEIYKYYYIPSNNFNGYKYRYKNNIPTLYILITIFVALVIYYFYRKKKRKNENI